MLIVLCTFPDTETARRIVTTLVTEQLAACFNLIPAVESIYIWQGNLETCAEVLALGKTTEAAWPALQARLKKLHPYEVPEILALPVTEALPEYLRWVEIQVKPTAKSQPTTASHMFPSSSSSDSACVTHPGNAGTSTQ